MPNSQLSIQLGTLAVFSPLVLIAGTHNGLMRGEMPRLWLYFLAVAIISYCASFIRGQLFN